MTRICTCLLALMLLAPVLQTRATEPAGLPEPEGARALQQESSRLFLAGDYAGLDARMAHYVTQGTRSSSGRWASGILLFNPPTKPSATLFVGVQYDRGHPRVVRSFSCIS